MRLWKKDEEDEEDRRKRQQAASQRWGKEEGGGGKGSGVNTYSHACYRKASDADRDVSRTNSAKRNGKWRLG